ncbi:MAG: insulinase family protein [Ruminococcaceae bacterium]|nr:insulinase family protein [Oscillospiraceae bacterium]
MQIKDYTLREGVSLTVLSTDKFKSNLMIVELRCPLKKETATHNSLITNVLSRCCREYPTLRQFNVALEELYAADLDAYVSKIGEVQKVCFKLSCIENKYTYDGADVLAGGMRLLGEMIFNPLLEDGVFPLNVVNSEKKNLKEEIEALKDDKSRFALNRCVKNMCPDEPYSVATAGDVEVLAAITPKELKESYDALIATPPVSIYFVGREDPDKVREYCDKYLPFAPRKTELFRTDVKVADGEVKRITEMSDAVQSRLCMGFRTARSIGDDDYSALLLACDVLGSPSGKLFVNVREKMGLCYYCHPLLDGVKGLLIVSAGIAAEDREKAEKAILKQIEDLKQGNITESELKSAKAAALNAYKEITDSPSSVIGWYSTRRGLGLSLTPEQMAAKIESTTAEDIARAAKDIMPDTFYMLEGGGEQC